MVKNLLSRILHGAMESLIHCATRLGMGAGSMRRNDTFSPVVGFRAHTAAQACAYLCLKANEPITKLKLIKLVYLAERKFIELHGHPMFYDEPYSLPHGPILSSTLHGIDGKLGNHWPNILKRSGNDVRVSLKLSDEDFDLLSKAEREALDHTWKEFGGMTASQLRNYTHIHCKEYTEVETGRRLGISYKELCDAVGIEDSEQTEQEIRAYRKAEALLSD